MGAIINSEGKSSHWYNKDGSPQHTVPYKDKKRAAAGEMKRTTLTDARGMGLLPSVTNIMGMMAKPALDDWRQEQLLIAASNNQYNPQIHPDLATWMRQVHSDAQTIVEEARAIGQSAHSMIEDYARGLTFGVDPVGEYAFRTMEEWFDRRVKEVIRTECTVTSDDYAGTLDMMAVLEDDGAAIIDYKTRRGGWKMDRHGIWRCATYPEDMIQLGAYRHAICEAQGVSFDDPEFGCLSVVVASEAPQNYRGTVPAMEHRWTVEEMRRGRDIFLNLVEAWKKLKSYDPGTTP